MSCAIWGLDIVLGVWSLRLVLCRGHIISTSVLMRKAPISDLRSPRIDQEFWSSGPGRWPLEGCWYLAYWFPRGRGDS